jgi:hypothetical protein
VQEIELDSSEKESSYGIYLEMVIGISIPYGIKN